MKQLALVMVAALALFPRSAFADGEAGRHLRYVALAQVDGVPANVVIDLDIGSSQRENVARVRLNEHRPNQEIDSEDVAIDRDGTISGAHESLTFEEETILDLVALQFENMSGVDPGDHWDRSGDLRLGSHETHYVVREHDGAGMIALDVARTMEFPDGSRGTWRGDIRYDASAVVPRSIVVRGEVVNEEAGTRRPLQLSARLIADSFQPSR